MKKINQNKTIKSVIKAIIKFNKNKFLEIIPMTIFKFYRSSKKWIERKNKKN